MNKKGLRTPRGSEFNATAVRRLMLSLNVSL
nr:recombinase family protein [Pseudomonas putida]